MDRLRRALDAGWDSVELREQYNAAVAEKRSAEAALQVAPSHAEAEPSGTGVLRRPTGRHGTGPRQAEADELSQLYSSLRLSLMYHHAEQIVDVEVDPLVDHVDKLRVRGEIRTVTTRLILSA